MSENQESIKMKIDKVTSGHVSHTSLQHTPKKTAENSVQSQRKNEKFHIDTLAIEQAQKDMAASPDIDMAKVNQIRNALTNGELNLDSKVLTKALMQFYTGHE